MNRDVSVVIATIPPRAGMLQRALASVAAQTHTPDHIAIEVDHTRTGDGPTRTRAMAAVRTTWIAFLDDDDELLPEHLQTCLDAAEDTGADVVVPWFAVIGGTDPIPNNRGLQPDPDGRLRNAEGQFPSFGVTNLVRTEVAQAHAFGLGVHDDYRFWCDLDEAGACIRMVPEITWLYHHDSANTSGEPDRW